MNRFAVHTSRTGTSLVCVLLALAASTGAAQRFQPAFRDRLERDLRPGRTHLVIVKPGLPTATTDNQDPVAGNIIVQLGESDWKLVPVLGVTPRAADFLYESEVMRLYSIQYGPNTVDLRLVSVEPHKSMRGYTKLVATTFRVNLPPGAEMLNEDSVPGILKGLEPFLKQFSDEATARKFAATLGKE